MLGVLGIGFGLWWADAAAAGLISLDILWDGAKNVRRIFTELVDRIPEKVDSGEEEPVVEGVAAYLRALPWITAFDVRLHQRGDTFVGDVTLVPADERDLTRRIEEAITRIRSLDWRLSQITFTPLPALPEGEGEGGLRWKR